MENSGSITQLKGLEPVIFDATKKEKAHRMLDEIFSNGFENRITAIAMVAISVDGYTNVKYEITNACPVNMTIVPAIVHDALVMEVAKNRAVDAVNHQP